KQRRHFRACLREAENVVDEEEHVLSFRVPEVFGDRQSTEGDAQTRAWRLGHLSIDEGCARLARVFDIDDATLLKLEPEVVALARPLPYPGKHRHASMLRGDVVNELLD